MLVEMQKIHERRGAAGCFAPFLQPQTMRTILPICAFGLHVAMCLDDFVKRKSFADERLEDA